MNRTKQSRAKKNPPKLIYSGDTLELGVRKFKQHTDNVKAITNYKREQWKDAKKGYRLYLETIRQAREKVAKVSEAVAKK